MLPRKAEDPLEDTHAANSLSRTKASYTSSPCVGIGSPPSDQTVRQGNQGAYLDHCRHVWGANVS